MYKCITLCTVYTAVHSTNVTCLAYEKKILAFGWNRILFVLSGWELELATLKATFRCATFWVISDGTQVLLLLCLALVLLQQVWLIFKFNSPSYKSYKSYFVCNTDPWAASSSSLFHLRHFGESSLTRFPDDWQPRSKAMTKSCCSKQHQHWSLFRDII